MKKVFLIFASVVLLAACTPKQVSVPTSDSTVVAVDTVQVDSIKIDTTVVK